MEIERVHVDGRYLWTYHRRGFLHYAGKQGLQPAVETLTYGDGQKVRSPSGSHRALHHQPLGETKDGVDTIIKATNIQFFPKNCFCSPFILNI